MKNNPSSPKKPLREGFSTGSAAAAAAMGALQFLLTGDAPAEVDIPMVDEGRLRIPIDQCRSQGELAICWVVKDAGDDPDATDKARIFAEVSLVKGEHSNDVAILGGEGVGVATLPGLSVPVGEAAINPGPRRQIAKAVREVLAQRGVSGSVRVVIGVENGAEIARHTMNERLGIVGGISILGTTGVVRPLSHEAWKSSVVQSLDVAAALGLQEVCLSTGRRSERLFLAARPEFPDQGAIQAGDFFEFALREASQRGFSTIWWSVFFGKLVKQSMGLSWTHARDSRLDLDWLANVCAQAGSRTEIVDAVRTSNTARQALDFVRGRSNLQKILELLGAAWRNSAFSFSRPGQGIGLMVHDLDGVLLFEQSWRGT